MTLQGMVILLIFMVLMPAMAGGIPMAFYREKRVSLGFMWISGCMMMWALFQVLCVGCTLRLGEKGYLYLEKGFFLGMCFLAGVGTLLTLIKSMQGRRQSGEGTQGIKRRPSLAWVAFFLLLGFQLYMSVGYTYGDGDDAYYVAVSTLTQSSKTLYKLMPYSMGNTQMDLRHALAPFPVFIAMLGEYTGLKPVLIAHSLLPGILFLMTYTIYYLIAEILFSHKKDRIPVFLSLTALLILFGDTSFYTMENFMIARSRQGKAALGSIVIPAMLLFILLMMKEKKEQTRPSAGLLISLLSAVTAACLCSTMGTLLSCMLLGIMAVIGAVVYRSFSLMVKMAFCCIPAIGYAVLYLIL